MRSALSRLSRLVALPLRLLSSGSELSASVRFAGIILLLDAMRYLPRWLNVRGHSSYVTYFSQAGLSLAAWEWIVAWLWDIVHWVGVPTHLVLAVLLILAPRTAKVGFASVLGINAAWRVLEEAIIWIDDKHSSGVADEWSISIITMGVALPAAIAGWYWLVIRARENRAVAVGGRLLDVGPPVSRSLIVATLGALTVYLALYFNTYANLGLGHLQISLAAKLTSDRLPLYVRAAAEAGVLLALALATVRAWLRPRSVLSTLWVVFTLCAACPLIASLLERLPVRAYVRSCGFLAVITGVLIALVYIQMKIRKEQGHLVCSECGYFVGGAPSTRCPECGTAIGETPAICTDGPPHL